MRFLVKSILSPALEFWVYCSDIFEFRNTDLYAKLQRSPMFDISILLKKLDWFYEYLYI